MEKSDALSPDPHIAPEPTPEPEQPSATPPVPEKAPNRLALRVPVALAGVTAALLASGAGLYFRAASATNHVALSDSPKGVTTVRARTATFRPFRRYVATTEPWVRAAVGPQLVAAYVETVLVRPGATVKRGEVLATLDCRHASAADQAVAASARALDAKRSAMAKESERVSSLLDGGFVSANEVDQKAAEVASMEAQLAATRAQLTGRSLEVSDCVLRAPFDGEVAERTVDPGAFVRPGQSIALVVDRDTIRISVEVPETDFEVVAPGTEVTARLLATGKTLKTKVSRRAPAADLATRTLHVEMDIPDPERAIPIGTSAELRIDVGEPQPAIEIPLTAASVKGAKATVCIVENGIAHFTSVPVLGERDGKLFVGGKLTAGALVVTEGRALLNDNDHVQGLTAEETAPAATAAEIANPSATGSVMPAKTGSSAP